MWVMKYVWNPVFLINYLTRDLYVQMCCTGPKVFVKQTNYKTKVILQPLCHRETLFENCCWWLTHCIFAAHFPHDNIVMNDLYEPVFHLLSGRIWKHCYVSVNDQWIVMVRKDSLFLSLFSWRLGCWWTRQRWDKSRSSHFSDSSQKVRNRILGKTFSGGTIPALWHSEKIWT